MFSTNDYGLKGLRRGLEGPYSLRKKNKADRMGLRALQPPRQKNPYAGGPYDMGKNEQRMRGYVGGLGLGILRS